MKHWPYKWSVSSDFKNVLYFIAGPKAIRGWPIDYIGNSGNQELGICLSKQDAIDGYIKKAELGDLLTMEFYHPNQWAKVKECLKDLVHEIS